MHLHLGAAAVLTSLVSLGSSRHVSIRAPTKSDWQALNTSVEGRLQVGVPFAKPCFSSFNKQPSQPDPVACQSVQQVYFNNSLERSNHFGAWSATQWEECMPENTECDLNWMNPSDGAAFNAPKDCEQGGVASYYIDVRKAEDAKAALKFVKKTGVTLTIKNTGHDFNGRSAAPNALALWTHNLKNITHSTSFIPEGCSSKTKKSTAVTFGSGAQFGELSSYTEAVGLFVITGTDEGVGAAGGWGQGGGHSSMSHALGMGADRTLQYKVVTPDGVLRTANECQNQDLFWALRGGGGGTFGVVMEATVVASPRIPLRVTSISWTPTDDNYRQVLKMFIDNATTFAEQGWGGYVTMNIGNIVMQTPKLTMEEAQASVKALVDLTNTMGGQPSVVSEVSSYQNWFNQYMQPNSGSQDAIGLPIVFSSRIVPKKNHDTEQSREELFEALFEAQKKVFWTQIMFTTPYGSGFDGKDTSVNPIWRSSLYHVMLVNTWTYGATLADKKEAWKVGGEAADLLRAVTPGAGAYHNEGDVHEPNWQYSFWGSNYPRLLSIKKKYDPTGILDCWHCVGWQGEKSPRFRCYV